MFFTIGAKATSGFKSPTTAAGPFVANGSTATVAVMIGCALDWPRQRSTPWRAGTEPSTTSNDTTTPQRSESRFDVNPAPVVRKLSRILSGCGNMLTEVFRVQALNESL